ncbi:MAG TPA: MDR family MFS transporter [Nocardioides sp.]|nr:MDR family MFS transporter [Nocardioides sp.]
MTDQGTQAETRPMTHREILEALTGLLLAMFVAMLSSTVVSNALPRIVTDLHGDQTGYTWVVVATLLTMTATTPIWGKLADLFSKKLLVQSALVIYSVGSLLAAFAPSMGVLIGARAVQGLGVGGLTALVQVVIASMVSPRERGRYSGYIGAVFATATVSGPLLGGVIVDSALGWRGCFFVGLPIAALAFVVLQKTLHLPVVKRDVRIDYLGATLIMGGISVLLVWVSLAGNDFDWVSATSALLVAAGLALIALAVWVEARVAAEPVIPLRLFRDRTTALATVASVMIGVAMFGATVYLSQYFQLARGMSPTRAGLMSIAMVGGLLVSSIVTGRIITRTGRWKAWLVGGMVLVIAGLALLGTIDGSTPLVVVGVYMAVTGLGLGATMQNLVLSVQNNVTQADLGAASSVVAMFRSIGGSVGVSALGAVLAHQVTAGFTDGLGALVAKGAVTQEQLAALRHSTGDIPDLEALPAPLRALYEASFGDATGHLFLIAVPFAVLALLCVLFIKEVPLRTTIDVSESATEAGVVATGEPVDWPAFEAPEEPALVTGGEPR